MGKVMLGLFPKDLRVRAWSRVAAVGAGNDTRWSLGKQSSKRTAELTSSSLFPD